MSHSNGINPEEFFARPWVDLTTAHDVEAWIASYNTDLQRCVNKKNSMGYGVCFSLGQGGQIFMHTTEDAILLDVTPQAQWLAPVITAATGIEASQSQLWVLPNDRLTQLVLGLNSLIATSKIDISHSYKTKKY